MFTHCKYKFVIPVSYKLSKRNTGDSKLELMAILTLTRRRVKILLLYSGITTLLSLYCRYSSDTVVDLTIRKRDGCRAAIGEDTTDTHIHLQTQGETVFNTQDQSELPEDSDIEKRFAKRRFDVNLACSRINLPPDNPCRMNSVKRHVHLVESYNNTFCTIEKAGSTFLKRILKVISTPPMHRKALSPFDYKRGIIYNTEKTMHNLNFSDDDVRERMKTSTNTILVRDPYTRIFSFYLDKLYNINTYFWFHFGTHIVKKERRNPTNTSLTCGHDVTFTELISHLVKMMKNQQRCPLDGHLSSNYDHCSPCHYNYTYIGKYETLHEDLYHILAKEGMDTYVNLSNWGELNDLDSFDDSVKFAFLDRHKIETCMPFVSGLRRVWKQQQSRGMLDKRAKFPFTENDSATITPNRFLEALIKAYREFDPKYRLPNRNEALSEAYRSLDTSLIKEFNEAFRLDFEIFGYKIRPPIGAMTDYKYLVFE